MTLNVSYPGIYLSEQNTNTISIPNGQAIVPLFVCSSGSRPSTQGVLYFDSYNDIDKYGKDNGNIYHISISLWFRLGGGKCYMARVPDIEKAVQQYDEINLIVTAGFAGHNSDQTMDSQSGVIAAANNLAASGRPVFTLLDGPEKKITQNDLITTIIPGLSSTPHAAVFYPWCQYDSEKYLAPSIVAALAIAKTDSTRGAWKAPCNVPISGITPRYPVTDDLQGKFNQGMALNMIRTFPETGTVLWGARTLEDSDNWRYIPVRRLFDMVEKNIKTALGKLIFEPNSQPTWHSAKAAVDNYLHRLWQQGALMGNKPEEAWFIEIGKDITMTQDDINQGKMIMKIGMAAVRPAEFIILQLTQDLGQ
ncbi:phage tail sheath family protein [Enterobacter kobei]|uniref:phage tail sheath family protein n=1 Tax=Enterobacter kobei TaxID=208224 RepID=UPI003CEA827E